MRGPPGERVIIRAYYTMKSLALARARGHQFLFLCRRGGSWLHDVCVCCAIEEKRKKGRASHFLTQIFLHKLYTLQYCIVSR